MMRVGWVDFRENKQAAPGEGSGLFIDGWEFYFGGRRKALIAQAMLNTKTARHRMEKPEMQIIGGGAGG